MHDLLWLIPALPLLGFVLLAVFGARFGEPFAGWVATAMVGGSFLASVALFFAARSDGGPEHHAPPQPELLWRSTPADPPTHVYVAR